MTHHNSAAASYLMERDELLRIRNLKLLTSDLDYVFLALQIDSPSNLNPMYKALGNLRKKGIACLDF